MELRFLQSHHICSPFARIHQTHSKIAAICIQTPVRYKTKRMNFQNFQKEWIIGSRFWNETQIAKLQFPLIASSAPRSFLHSSRGFASHPWHSSRCRLSSCYLLPAYYLCTVPFTPLNSRRHLSWLSARVHACTCTHVCPVRIRIGTRLSTTGSPWRNACTRAHSYVYLSTIMYE